VPGKGFAPALSRGPLVVRAFLFHHQCQSGLRQHLFYILAIQVHHVWHAGLLADVGDGSCGRSDGGAGRNAWSARVYAIHHCPQDNQPDDGDERDGGQCPRQPVKAGLSFPQDRLRGRYPGLRLGRQYGRLQAGRLFRPYWYSIRIRLVDQRCDSAEMVLCQGLATICSRGSWYLRIELRDGRGAYASGQRQLLLIVAFERQSPGQHLTRGCRCYNVGRGRGLLPAACSGEK